MRISWLSPHQIAAAREALTADGRRWEDHFAVGKFVAPPAPAEVDGDWQNITEHVARAERVSEVIRDLGFEEACARFGTSTYAIEAATIAAAAHENEVVTLDQVIAVLGCDVDPVIFYAPFLELMISLGAAETERIVATYEKFARDYSRVVVDAARGPERIGAVYDGLADYYVSAGRLDDAEALFERRHHEDRGDVAVALSASRAFLAAGSVSHAVRWLGVGADRAEQLGRADLATRLRKKQERVRERLS